MQRLNSPDRVGVYHYLTLNVRDRKTAFRRPEYTEMLARLLRYECDRHPAKLAAFVIMPDHLHALLDLEDGQLSRFLKRFKSNATRNLDHFIKQNERKREGDWLCEKGRRELWQDSKYSIPIYSPSWIRQKIDYIHNNPVTRNLVVSPQNYLWSSFGAYRPDSGHNSPISTDIAEVY